MCSNISEVEYTFLAKNTQDIDGLKMTQTLQNKTRCIEDKVDRLEIGVKKIETVQCPELEKRIRNIAREEAHEAAEREETKECNKLRHTRGYYPIIPEVTTQSYYPIIPEVTTQSYQRLLPNHTRGYYPIIPEVTTQSYQRLLPNHTTQSYQRLLPNHTTQS